MHYMLYVDACLKQFVYQLFVSTLSQVEIPLYRLAERLGSYSPRKVRIIHKKK